MNFHASPRATDAPSAELDLDTVLADALPDRAPDPAEDPAQTVYRRHPDPAAATGPASFLAALDSPFETAPMEGPPDEPGGLFGAPDAGAVHPAFDPAAPTGGAIFDPDPPVYEPEGEFRLPPEAPANGSSALFGASGADGGSIFDEDPPVYPADADFQHAPEAPVPDSLADFEDALVEGLSEDPATSSGEPEPGDVASSFDPSVLSGEAVPEPDAPVPEIDGDAEREQPPAKARRPVAALAFAMDPATEDALRNGLLHYRKPSLQYDDPEVWTGGLRAAVAALAGGHSARLVIVDIDGMPYPGGAIHELAEVCEMGTSVIAIGSDDTARSSRELLLAGVSDYLVKPIAPAAVTEAAARAAGPELSGAVRGIVVGFTGTGGSGATTLLAATALQAADRGRYVSVLDLDRTAPSAAGQLDVEPSAGLDQILEVSVGRTPDPQMLDGVQGDRSERISVYAFRGSSAPHPVPSIPALEWLLGELRHRSQLVLVDGLDDPEMRFALLAQVDMRVLVAEPTGKDIIPAARIVELLGDGAPTLLVRNHTRELKRGSESGLFLEWGTDNPLDVEVPFEPTLPAISNRGWPDGRMPRRLRKSLSGLTDHILMNAPDAAPSWAESSSDGRS